MIIAESLYSYIEQKIARLDLDVLVMYIFASTYTWLDLYERKTFIQSHTCLLLF